MNTKTTATQIVGISEDNIPECNISYSRSWRSRLGLRTVYKKSDIINFNGPTALTMTMAGHNRSSEIPGQTSDSRVPLGFDAAWISSLPFSSVLAVWREGKWKRGKPGQFKKFSKQRSVCHVFQVLWAAKRGEMQECRYKLFCMRYHVRTASPWKMPTWKSMQANKRTKRQKQQRDLLRRKRFKRHWIR